jgi:hypothetical protein
MLHAALLLLLLQGKRSAAGQGGTAKKARVDGEEACIQRRQPLAGSCFMYMCAEFRGFAEGP